MDKIKIPVLKAMIDIPKKPKRYVGRVKSRDRIVSGEYVDWFTDDDDARATYRVIMEQQGYKVKNVTVENQTAIVEIE